MKYDNYENLHYFMVTESLLRHAKKLSSKSKTFFMSRKMLIGMYREHVIRISKWFITYYVKILWNILYLSVSLFSSQSVNDMKLKNRIFPTWFVMVSCCASFGFIFNSFSSYCSREPTKQPSNLINSKPTKPKTNQPVNITNQLRNQLISQPTN